MADRPVVEYTAHITPSTPLLPALRAWELYLADQGRSIYTWLRIAIWVVLRPAI
jgi:hypothetical protein